MAALESGKYHIRSRLLNAPLGRYTIEDLSPLPKRIMRLNVGAEAPEWEILKQDEGGYQLKCGGSYTAKFKGGVYAILLGDPIAEHWRITEVPQHGINVYIIESQYGGTGWVAEGNENQPTQIQVKELVASASEPPEYQQNALFEIDRAE